MFTFKKLKFTDFTVTIFAILLVLIGVLAMIAAWRVPSSQFVNLISLSSASFSGAASLVSLKTIIEINKDRLQREQPSVIVDFKFLPNSCVHFIVRNTGNGIARNIKIKFDPSPLDFANIPFQQRGWLQNPIDIVPGGHEEDLLNMAFSLFDEGQPEKFSVTVSYENERGEECPERIFNFNFKAKEMQIHPPKTVDEYSKEIAESLSRIERNIANVINYGSLTVEMEQHKKDRLAQNIKNRAKRKLIQRNKRM